MAFPQGQLAGKLGAVLVGGISLASGMWDANDKADKEDTTTFESAGFSQGTVGIEVVEISFGGLYDSTLVPYDDPPGIYPRDDLQNVAFLPRVGLGQEWSFPYLLILSSKNSTSVRGTVTHEASGESNGEFTRISA